MIITIILNYEGGIYLSQVRVRHLSEIPISLLKAFDWGAVVPSPTQSVLHEFILSVADSTPVEISGLRQVWCMDGRLGGKHALIHIVNTAPGAIPS
jgi:hypothetical protein